MRFVLPLLVFMAVVAGPAAGQEQGGDEPPVAGDTPSEPAPDAGPAEEPVDVAAAASALAAAQRPLDRAFARLGTHDWEECIAPFQEAADLLAPHPLLGGVRDQCLYNVACALARIDRPQEAVEAFAESVAHGLRPVARPTEDGRVVLSPGLSFAHVLADPDLDSLRGRDDFRAVLDGLLRAGTPRVAATEAAEGDGPFPGVVVVLSEDRDVDEGARPWEQALAEAPAVVAYVEGPVRPNPRTRRWLLLDGDDRFGIAKVREALAALRADPRVDPERVFVIALTSSSAEVAFAAALESPRDVSGLALGPFRYHAPWHADALHDLAAQRGGAAPWTLTCVTLDDAFAKDVEAAGITLDRLDSPPPVVPPEQRGAVLRQTVLDGLRALLAD